MIKQLLINAGLMLTMAAAGSASAHCANPPRTAEKVLAEAKALYAPDTRQNVWTLKAKNTAQGTVITGDTEAAIAPDVRRMLSEAGIKYIDSINVIKENGFALVNISVAHMRTRPGHSQELASQAIMGMPVRLLDKNGEFWRAQTPDGYIAYIIGNSLQRKTDAEMEAWRKASRLVVTSPYQVRAWDSPNTTSLRHVVTDLVNGSIVEGPLSIDDNRYEIALPDGRRGWVDMDAVTPIEKWADQPFDAEKILDLAYSMEGQPYLWGGTSTKSLDCSGLSKVCYLSNGIILMRDASQQALTGRRIDASDWRNCQAGDLLFFGNASTGKVTHVAIYDHDGKYVHSSGRVKRNSVDPADPTYLTTPFLHAVRIHGSEGTKGIVKAINHPWYFL